MFSRLITLANQHESGLKKHQLIVYCFGLTLETLVQVLYVGDHIYGDILRSKKELGKVAILFETAIGVVVAEVVILRLAL